MAETGDLWAGPPLVCPACRGNGDAHRLGSDLRCSNSTCGARYGVLEGTTIPVVASPPVIERVPASDVPGALPAHGGLASWLKDLRPDTAAFGPVGRAAIFLRAMRVGSEELFYADLCDALLPDLPAWRSALR